MSVQGFTATIASGAATSTAIDLGYAKSLDRVYVNNEAGAEIKLEASVEGDEFYTLTRQDDSIFGKSFTTQIIGSALSGNWVGVEAGHRFIRAIATGAVADGGNVYFSVVYE